MKKTLALLLALIMAFSVFSVAAFAAGNATVNVALVDSEGNAVTSVKAGEPVWAVISVANYEDYVGEMTVVKDGDNVDVAASAYDKVISIVTTFLELDTANFTAAANDGNVVWESPYKANIDEQGGSMAANFDGNVLKLLLQTDCEGGLAYSISKSELDANNGELFRVKLKAKKDATQGDYTVALNGGDSISAPGIATVSSATGDVAVDVADVPVTFGAAANIAIGEGTYEGSDDDDGEIIPPVDPNPGVPDEPDEPDTPVVPDEPVVDGVLVGVGFEYDATAGNHPVTEDWIFSHVNTNVHSSKGLRLKDGGDTEALDVSATYKNNFVLTNGFDLSYTYECWWNAANYEANRNYHGAKVGNISAAMTKQSGSKFNHVIMIDDVVVATGKVGATVTGSGKTSYTLSYDPATKTITLTWANGETTDTVKYVDTAKLVDLSDATVEFFANASWDVSEYINSAKLVGKEASDIPPEEEDPEDPEEPEETGPLTGLGLVFDATAGNHPVTADWIFSHVNAIVHSSKGLRLKDGGDTEALDVSATYKNKFDLTNGFDLSYTYECWWDPNNYEANRTYHGAKVGNISAAMIKQSGSQFDHVIMIDDAVVATGTVGATVAGGGKTSYTLSYDPVTRTITLTWASGSTTDTVQYVDSAKAVDVSDAAVEFFANASWSVSEYINSAKLVGKEAPAAHDHVEGEVVVENNVAADCDTAGSYDNVVYCTICGTELSRETITVAALGHTEVIDAAVAPDCGNTGLTEGKHCSVCGEVIVAQTVIPATGDHAWGEFVPDEDGTTETRACGTCGKTETQDIVGEECAHEWGEWEITTAATSTTAGIKTRTCGLCGAEETEEYTIATSGTSGETTWRFENGTLYIEGTGAMGNYFNVGEVQPWQGLRTEITAIVVGDEVTHIGNRAFKNLNKAKTAVFGKNVTTMGYECFQGCTQLASVSINEGLTAIGAHAFYDCAIDSVTIPSTVTKLENRAFKNCKKLTSVVIPNGVKTTGYEIFMGCTSLTDATISTGLNMINPHAFQGCTSLTDIYIPQNIFRIRSKAFAECTALASVTFEDDDKLYASSTEATIASEAFLNCPATLTFKGWMQGTVNNYADRRGFQFEATNTSVFKYTPDDNNNATITGMRGNSTKADIPETIDGYTVVAIGKEAFRDNTVITRVTIPATVTTIYGRAFQGCTALQTVNGLENVTTIQYNAFANCSAITSVSFSADLKELAAATFQNCTALGEIYVPNTITTVNNTAFSGCTNATIKTQADSAAAKAAAKAGVAVKVVTCFDYTVNEDGESVTVTGVIGNVTELVIPDEINGYKVTAIDKRAFKNNTTITSVVIGNNVTSISYEVFMNCTSVTSVEIGTGVTTIGSKAFAGMTNLESFTIKAESVSFNNETFTGANANMVVYGVAGSSTQTFVEKKGFTFVAL